MPIPVNIIGFSAEFLPCSGSARCGPGCWSPLWPEGQKLALRIQARRPLSRADPVAAGPLSLIQRLVRGQQRMARGRRQPRQRGDTEGEADPGQAPFADALWNPRQALLQCFRRQPGGGQIGVRQDQRELVTSIAAGNVGASHGGPDDLGRLTQHRVTGEMTVLIVELFELINVNHHQACGYVPSTAGSRQFTYKISINV